MLMPHVVYSGVILTKPGQLISGRKQCGLMNRPSYFSLQQDGHTFGGHQHKHMILIAYFQEASFFYSLSPALLKAICERGVMNFDSCIQSMLRILFQFFATGYRKQQTLILYNPRDKPWLHHFTPTIKCSTIKCLSYKRQIPEVQSSTAKVKTNTNVFARDVYVNSWLKGLQ
ncbi:hypothetical protein TNCV_2749321 [Trichonephila clavipes]|nr:hypothetical protein TNCV_2749321 [Trichonephila clavipes]